MELIFKQYHFDIKTGSINCIMGKGIDLEEFTYACQSIKKIEILIQPVINQLLYKDVKRELTSSFNKSNNKNNNIILDALKMVGLNSTYINRKINSLSSSELFLIKLASILIINPKIIVLENPTVYLDSKKVNNFLKIIRTIKRRYNKTIIIFSDNSDFVHNISDYIFIINEKDIISEGNKYDVFNDYKRLKLCHIKPPKIIEFEQKALKNKNINLGVRDNINDLIKDIYYNK